MNDRPERSLEDRVARLERSVENLERTVKDLITALARRESTAAPSASDASPTRPPPRPSAVPKTPFAASLTQRKASTPDRGVARQVPRNALANLKKKSPGFWLSRLGIGLLLLGVAFLFKYAVDLGWLTPRIRIGFGLVLGLALVTIGLRVKGRQRWFAPVMFGGASATFYITGFAAFQLFDLLSFPVAFGFMVAVTLFTFWAAIRTNAATLAVIGALGALGTPFLLYTDRGSVAGLTMYTSVVLVGTSAIYLHRGWLSLLWTTVLGGWAVLGVGLSGVGREIVATSSVDLWGLQVAGIVALFGFWAVPVMRDALSANQPEKWYKPPRLAFARMMGVTEERLGARSTATLALTMPLVTFFFMRESGPYGDWLAGGVAWGLAALLIVAWWRLGKSQVAVIVRSMHAVAASVLVAIGLQYAFENHTLLVTWAVEVFVLQYVARRINERALSFTGHVLFVIVTVWLAGRLTSRPDLAVVFNARAITHAIAILVIGAASYQLSGDVAKRWYRLAAIFAFAGWCWSELGALPDGAGVVLVAWSAIGVLLLVLARHFTDPYYRRSGHLLFAVIGYWLATRFTVEDQSGRAMLNTRTLLHLGALSGTLIGSTLLEKRVQKLVYLSAVHVLFLMLLWQELSGLAGGHGFVSIAWGVYALALLLVGLRRDMSALRKAALATFFAVVVKLFLVDLSELDPLWRILLFLGFGGLFLVLSYYFTTLLRERDDGPPPAAPEPELDSKQ